jgi:hypothetical protein
LTTRRFGCDYRILIIAGVIIVNISRQKKPNMTLLTVDGNSANGHTAVINDSGGGYLTVTLPEAPNIPRCNHKNDVKFNS